MGHKVLNKYVHMIAKEQDQHSTASIMFWQSYKIIRQMIIN